MLSEVSFLIQEVSDSAGYIWTCFILCEFITPHIDSGTDRSVMSVSDPWWSPGRSSGWRGARSPHRQADAAVNAGAAASRAQDLAQVPHPLWDPRLRSREWGVTMPAGLSRMLKEWMHSKKHRAGVRYTGTAVVTGK